MYWLHGMHLVLFRDHLYEIQFKRVADFMNYDD